MTNKKKVIWSKKDNTKEFLLDAKTALKKTEGLVGVVGITQEQTWEKELSDLYWYDLCYAGDFSTKDKNIYAKEMAKNLNKKVETILKSQRHSLIEEIIEKVDKCFSDFLLRDWSGEEEVLSEIDRLKLETIKRLREL